MRDLWPESAVATGLVTNPRVIAGIDRLARWCYSRADRAVALTEGIRDGLVAAGMNAAAVTLVTNGIDLDVAANGAAPVPVPPNAFVAMFVGQHGTYSALETVLDAADLLRDDPMVRFVLVGGGDRKAALVAEAADRGLRNVAFVDPVPKREVPSWLARADVCLLPYQDRDLFAGALPNKTFDYLGAGAPHRGRRARGRALAPGARRGLRAGDPGRGRRGDGRRRAAAGRRPGAARAMGAAGAAYVREHYDRRALAARFVAAVESLV